MLRVMMLMICGCFLAQAAHAESPAIIALGCAPWDGPALRIKVVSDNAQYNVMLWSKGIKALKTLDHTVTVDNKQDESSLGTGTVCVSENDDKMKCSSEALKVELREGEIRPGEAVSGSINFKDTLVEFVGVVTARHEPCG